MSWTLFFQLIVLIFLGGAVIAVWIERAVKSVVITKHVVDKHPFDPDSNR